MTLEEARSNIQNVLDQLRMTKAEREAMDTSLRLLYCTALDAEDYGDEPKAA
jgi:hypothetical protein